MKLTSQVTRLTKHALMYVERVEHLANNEFKELLLLGEKESFFIFDRNYFKEIDIATIGTTLGLTLTIFFFFFNFDEHLLSNSQPNFYSHYNR